MPDLRMSFLQQLYSAHLPKSRPAGNWQGFSIHSIDMRPIKLNLGPFVPFLLLENENSLPESSNGTELLNRLIAFSREHAAAPTVFITARPISSNISDSSDLERHSIAVLDAPALEAFLNARDNESRYRILGSTMVRTIGYSSLSPYSSGSPVSANRFFGREDTLRRILTGKSIRSSTIVGNRRIGKTSLMHEIRERLTQVYVPGKSVHFAELYGSKCKTTWDAVYLILDQIGVQVPKNLAKYGALAPRYVRRMPQLLHEFARAKQTQVVLFIDEYDELLERDSTQKYEFTHLLRETAMAERSCYVIIAGFRYLMQMRTRQDSPLYNFTQEIQLTPLNKDETLNMINVPLSRIGIDIAETNIPAIIHRETRGQPELVQMYCQAVVHAVSKTRRAPTEAELLKVVNQNPEFNRTIMRAFLSNANDFEQVVCLELMRRAVLNQLGVAQFEFRFNDIEQILATYGYSLSNAEIGILINNLAVGSFVERVRGGALELYRFATPQLVRFCEGVGLENLLNTAISRLQASGPILEAISREPMADQTAGGEPASAFSGELVHDLHYVFEWKQDRALIVALLGPPGAGKSRLIAETEEEARAKSHQVVHVDLYQARELWSEDEFYQWLLEVIRAQWGFENWRVRHPRLDFNKLLDAALAKAKNPVLLVFDHLEALSDACARDLIASLGEVQDAGSAKPAVAKLRCIVCACASIYELRRRLGSPNLQLHLHVLPNVSMRSALGHAESFLIQAAHTFAPDALELIATLAGGERVFLELLQRFLPIHITSADVDRAVHGLLADAARVRYLALPAHLYVLDSDFRELADALIAGRIVRVPDRAEDVNRYQLLGATRVVAERPQEVRFRNGLVEKAILLVRDGINHELGVLKRLAGDVQKASTINEVLRTLGFAWRTIAETDATLRVQLRASHRGSFEISSKGVQPVLPRSSSAVRHTAPLNTQSIETNVYRYDLSYRIESAWSDAGCDFSVLVEPGGTFFASLSSRFSVELWTLFLAPLLPRILDLSLLALGHYTLESGAIDPKKVFVSSTFIDLVEHRAKIMEQVQRRDLFFRGMEYFGAQSSSRPVEFILEQVRSADVYLGIYARRYGSLDRKSGISMTELEYDEAVRLKKPRLCYVAHRDAQLKQAYIDSDPEQVARMNKFLDKIKASVVYEYKDLEDLARQVYEDLGDQLKLTPSR